MFQGKGSGVMRFDHWWTFGWVHWCTNGTLRNYLQFHSIRRLFPTHRQGAVFIAHDRPKVTVEVFFNSSIFTWRMEQNAWSWSNTSMRTLGSSPTFSLRSIPSEKAAIMLWVFGKKEQENKRSIVKNQDIS